MTDDVPERPPAVLDTSFWVAAYRAEVAANCLDLFDIVVPRAVEAEIRAAQVGAPHREYPYATLFRHLRSRTSDPPQEYRSTLGIFGAGEAETIALARDLGALLLINERPAALFAVSLGIVVVNVPVAIVTLRGLDIISDRAARRKLSLIEPITAAPIITDAQRALDALSLPDLGNSVGV